MYATRRCNRCTCILLWRASMGFVSSAWTTTTYCLQQTKGKGTCTLLREPVALQKHLLAPTGLSIRLGNRIVPNLPSSCLLVGYVVHSWIVNWEGVPWTLKSGFQPQLGLRLQILPFVQPSCIYTNEWHLHGTILQHQNWPTHSVPCH